MAARTIMTVFGTRPEAIKMAPVVRAVQESPDLRCVVCVSGQHRAMLDQVLEVFGITPDFDLQIMRDGQDLFDVTTGCLGGLRRVLQEVKPDVVLVHGDTTTTLASALAAYYLRIQVGHVEAGLRTGDKYAPFPEEINRHMIAPIVDYHFAPTAQAVANLAAEGVAETRVHLTGNTAIDALLWMASQQQAHPRLRELWGDRRPILMTAHRRETFGAPMRDIFHAVRMFLEARPEFHVVYPVHLNPNVRQAAREVLNGLPNLSLIEPVSYPELVFLLSQAEFVLTDSGGLQEEAPTLGKPVVVLRQTTERPEAVAAGCAVLVGADRDLILSRMHALADRDGALYRQMSRAANPFGDGQAAARIAAILAS